MQGSLVYVRCRALLASETLLTLHGMNLLLVALEVSNNFAALIAHLRQDLLHSSLRFRVDIDETVGCGESLIRVSSVQDYNMHDEHAQTYIEVDCVSLILGSRCD